MKKTIFFLLLLSGSYTLMAQEPTTKEKIKEHNGKIKEKTVTVTPTDNAVIVTDTFSAARVGSYGLIPLNLQNIYRDKYGNSYYSISTTKDANGKTVYVAYVNDNGVFRTEYLDEFGNPVANPNPPGVYNNMIISPSYWPVLESALAPSVVDSFKGKYGATLYSIKGVTGADGKTVYVITLNNNGVLTTQYVDETFTEVPNPYIK
jgi:hypothetical protein